MTISANDNAEKNQMEMDDDSDSKKSNKMQMRSFSDDIVYAKTEPKQKEHG